MKREAQFQSEVINEIYEIFPDCLVLKNDAGYLQGVPDLIILNGPNWAMLEVKQSSNARRQPNQSYYVKMFGRMSFCKFIYPENKEEVLHGLQEALRV